MLQITYGFLFNTISPEKMQAKTDMTGKNTAKRRPRIKKETKYRIMNIQKNKKEKKI